MIAFILLVPTLSCAGEHTMVGPGAYVPAPTEGIVDLEDLPMPQLVVYSRHHAYTPCSRCDHRSLSPHMRATLRRAGRNRYGIQPIATHAGNAPSGPSAQPYRPSDLCGLEAW